MAILQDIDNSQNMGLPSHFQLTNGRFTLIGGTDKVDDNIAVYMNFIGWFRFFLPDFILNVNSFLQNTTNFLNKYKNIVRLNCLEIGAKYFPFCSFYSVDFPVDYTDRKNVTMYIQYQYKLRNAQRMQTIKKIIV